MADIKVTGSANFSPVTNGLKKIGQESANVAKSSSRAGQSILSLSQGIEDFAAAGIRGAMNNIPIFIQQLGAGAGIAGAASIALVAVNELVKGLDKLADSRQQDLELKIGEGLGRQGFKASENELKRIDKLAEKAAESMRDMQEEFSMREAARGNRGRYFATQSELTTARSVFLLEKQGATEQEKKLAGIQEEIRLLEVRKSLISDSIKDQQQVPKQIQEQIDKEQQAVDTWKNMQQAISDAYKEATRIGASKEIAPSVPVSDAETGITTMAQKSAENIAAEKEANIRAEIAKVNASINQGDVEAARITAGVAEKQLEILTKKMEAAQKSLQLAESTSRVSSKELSNQQEMLKIEEEKVRLTQNEGASRGIPILGDLLNGGINRLLETVSFGKEKNIRGIDAGHMLSSSGRMGASGAEFNAAVATVNYQREALNELRKISRNTSKGGTATYN